MRLRQLRLDEQGERCLFRLPAVGADIGQKERARELLRERAAAFDAAAVPHVADRRAHDPNRVDARMVIEPAVFDGDDGTLQIGRDRGERHVVSLLVEPEPRLSVS